MAPVGVIRPILSTLGSVNHRFPSGPAVIPKVLPRVAFVNSVICPSGVSCPIRVSSVNQRFPSGPAAIPSGDPFGPGRGNSVTSPPG